MSSSVAASREAAFSLAVQAAAISWAAAAACARGEMAACSCARKAPGHDHERHGAGHSSPTTAASAFRWGGCSSDVEYGARLSRSFTDAAQPAQPAQPTLPAGHAGLGAPRLLMDSHNSKAGRKVRLRQGLRLR